MNIAMQRPQRCPGIYQSTVRAGWEQQYISSSVVWQQIECMHTHAWSLGTILQGCSNDVCWHVDLCRTTLLLPTPTVAHL